MGDFFKWFDGYECDKCTSIGTDGSIKKVKCQPCGYDQASQVESEDGASTVEKYQCDTCQKIKIIISVFYNKVWLHGNYLATLCQNETKWDYIFHCAKGKEKVHTML